MLRASSDGGNTELQVPSSCYTKTDGSNWRCSGSLGVFEVREGSAVLETGEMAWVKGVLTSDVIKGGGPFIAYSTLTFQDGSTIITLTKGISDSQVSPSDNGFYVDPEYPETYTG
jgi:hypothetical protein